MEHFIYKTTNTLNSRFYIGMHSTTNIDDGYLGSGKRIKAEIKKYGKQNFVREILEHLPSRDALCEREAELVCPELLKNPLCLNLKNGGEGGGTREVALAAWNKPEYAAKVKSGMSKWAAENKEASSTRTKKSAQTRIAKGQKPFGGAGLNAFKDKKHSEETRQQMCESQKGKQTGERNSQFGKCWVTNGVKSQSIKKEQLDEFLALGFRRGRICALS